VKDVQIEEEITTLSDNNKPRRRRKIGSLKPSDVPKPKDLDLTNDNGNDITIENSTIQLGNQSSSFQLANIKLPRRNFKDGSSYHTEFLILRDVFKTNDQSQSSTSSKTIHLSQRIL
jgi:hypothetical protein